MVQAATGSGKTLLALTAADRLEKEQNFDLRVKIVVPTNALMHQWHQSLKTFLADSSEDQTATEDIRKKIGLRGAGCKASPDCKYVIYVINSARYELARQILSDLKSGAPVLLIADECHRYESEQNRLIFEFFSYIKPYKNRFFSLGLSATLPHGDALSYLTSVLGPKIYSYDINKAASLHTVCQYDIYHIGLSFLPDENSRYQELTERMQHLFHSLILMHPFLKNMGQKERFETLRALAGSKNRKTAEAASLYLKLSYKSKNLVCLASSRISCACSLIERFSSTEKIIIFGERISQADELFQLLNRRYPGKIGRYHSKMGSQANRNSLQRFRDGDIRILIACKAVDEGLDVPDASIGIILSGTSTKRQRIQRLGRIIRKSEEKLFAALYYLHIAESSEDLCFLPDTGNTRIFELEYHTETKNFSHSLYDKAAQRLLRQMQDEGASPEKLGEARRCLQLGSVRSDWIPGRWDFDAKIKASKYNSDKNYWICMKKIAKFLK